VEKILVEKDTAVGVRLSDGREARADCVISACDGRQTIYDMLDGKYLDTKAEKMYRSFPVFPPCVQVSLGIARDFSAEPHWQAFRLDQPAMLAGVKVDRVPLRHFCKDPTMAPKGKSAVSSYYNADYAYWKKLSEDRGRYEAEKDKVAAFTLAELEKRYPGIQHQVEVIDVATPMTYERYTGNWQGSFMGWMNATKRVDLGLRLPGLKNFYMAGIWTQTGGGVPTAAMTGRGAIELLCHDDVRKFVATIP
jgi:phytoene dehydrogenase-like protein